jgi:hypothetical protein
MDIMKVKLSLRSRRFRAKKGVLGFMFMIYLIVGLVYKMLLLTVFCITCTIYGYQ